MSEIMVFKGSGARLKRLREELGLSRQDMGHRLGLSLPAYYKNEGGETFPGTSTLKLLEKELDVSMDWLMFGKGPMHYNGEKQRVAALEKELEALKKERELEREKVRANETAMAEKLNGKLIVENKPGLKDLFEWMDREPLLYHEVMVFFHKFKKGTLEPEESPSTDPPENG